MACYHPLAAVKTGFLTDSGKEEYKIVRSYVPELEEEFGKENITPIPCGKCLGCRLDYSRSWANRMMYELDHCKGKAIFVTLTYDDEHIAKNAVYEVDSNGELTDKIRAYSLCKKDFQDFMKRLRGRKKFEDREIRFYLAGEYGPRTWRSHGHAIIFNIGLEDFKDLEEFGVNELGQKYYKSDEFTGIWENGFTLLSAVTWQTCAYVSRYVQKKAVNGHELACDALGIEREFSLMSRRPGIGSKFFDDHPDLMEYSNQYLSDGNGSVKLPITKNLQKVLEKVDPVRYNEVKECNKKFASDAVLLELQNSDLGFSEYFERKESDHLARLTSLKRDKL